MESNYVNRYSDLSRVDLRSIARHVALSGLDVADTLRGRRAALRRPRVQILSFHHVFDDERESFRRLLRLLRQDHDFVTYSEAVKRVHEGNFERPAIAFTFDDGLASCANAIEILEELDARAMLFVCPTIVGVTDHAVAERFCRERLQMPTFRFLGWDELERWLARGHEIGSHTMTHANLAESSAQQLADEIGGSFDALRARIGSVQHFAWPFGRFFHFSPAAAKAVFDAGYVSCASGERGCHTVAEPDPRALCIRRDHTVAAWPAGHLRHFLIANSLRSSRMDNQWTY